MSAPVFVLLSLAGGVGAALRLVVDSLIRAATRTHFPVATVTINLVGSFLLGLLAGAAAGHSIDDWYAVLGTGLLGGFTTFSTASVETVRLAIGAPRGHAALNVFGTLLGAFALAWLGILLGSARG
ncbi:fluoride efflux transporter FluC [Cumulibacter manganitolerans]|uniref:fluoride efflux transporter FluC n=1 Tax=Cumulibacter manganitolerans TaxID=1884992 RepID=UPI0012956076|nr:CrcB family protein [Cumulibacter manganitolerans]